jgi:hypothetical protein
MIGEITADCPQWRVTRTVRKILSLTTRWFGLIGPVSFAEFWLIHWESEYSPGKADNEDSR